MPLTSGKERSSILLQPKLTNIQRIGDNSYNIPRTYQPQGMVLGKQTRIPMISQVNAAKPGGFSLCGGLCQCCTCLQPGFLATPTGAVKVAEFVVGFICQLLLLQYGIKYGGDLGAGYSVFLTTTSACLLTTSVLLFCYITSVNTYQRVRPSLFEVVFNGVACGLYIGASTFLATAVQMHLFYYYKTIPGFSAYPAMTATYCLGYVVGIVHGVDASMAFKYMRSTRSR